MALIAAFLTLPIVFWTLIVCEVIGLIWSVEKESHGWATFTVILCAALFIFEFSTFSAVFAAFIASPWYYVGIGLGAFLANVVIGGFWAYFKWDLYTSDRLREIEDKIKEVGREDAAKYFASKYWCLFNTKDILAYNFLCLKPDTRLNKAKITMWMIYCIPSMIWFVCNDPIRRAANWVFDQVRETFQGNSDKKFNASFGNYKAPIELTDEVK